MDIKVINAGNCMMCGKEIKVAIGRGNGKFPNIFFCPQCDEKRRKYDQNKKCGGEVMSDAKDIYWCTQHKLQTRPTFLCYMYDVAPGVDAKNTPAKDMKCENCSFCHKEVDTEEGS